VKNPPPAQLANPAACVVLGPLPPPLTGAAKNTKNMIDSLELNSVNVTAISTAVELKRESAGLSYHVARLLHVIGVTKSLLKSPSDAQVLYVVPDAGLGAWYTLFYLLFSFLKFDKIIFHHRSFAYISSFSRPMSLITRLTRNKALHVCLSEGMAKRFVENYKPVPTMVVTNACYVTNDILNGESIVTKDRVSSTLVLGHLSTLRRDKGFFDVAEVFETLVQKNNRLELHLAGPVTEPQVKARLEKLIGRYGSRVRYYGQVSGTVKTEFYRTIDLFLFPTQHPQEAQPNVLFEALAAGVPILATPHAAIPEMIVGENGYCSPSTAEFVEFATSMIPLISFDEKARTNRQGAILSWIWQESARSHKQYLRLMEEFGLTRDQVKVPWTQ